MENRVKIYQAGIGYNQKSPPDKSEELFKYDEDILSIDLTYLYLTFKPGLELAPFP